MGVVILNYKYHIHICCYHIVVLRNGHIIFNLLTTYMENCVYFQVSLILGMDESEN